MRISPCRRIAATLWLSLLAACGGGGGSSGGLNPVPPPKAALAVKVSTFKPGATVRIVLTNTSSGASIRNPVIVLAPWLNAIAHNQNLSFLGLVAPGETRTFSFALGTDPATREALFENYQYVLSNPTSDVLAVEAANFAKTLRPQLDVEVAPSTTYRALLQDVLINADLWDTKPEIMSAAYGFQGIEGVGSFAENTPTKSEVIAAGGAWESIETPNPPAAAYTTAMSPRGVAYAFGYPTYLADAMPVCFSWPVQPSTVSRKNFAVTLNSGEVVQPYVASIAPNLEYNERACVVIFGTFGNRKAPGEAGALYPSKVTIVRGDAPLKLVGPNGPVSAVGLTKASTNPYASRGGPRMNAAKLSVMSTQGEGAPAAFSSKYPNDCVAYYGAGIGYRLRTFSTGGTSPDGVAAILPSDFAKYFELQVTDRKGGIHWITQAGVRYTFKEGTIEVIGLADLGKDKSPLNDAYVADRDNQIDICLTGDEPAMRLITGLKIPASGKYAPLYNPGGPGNHPTPGVRYTEPGPAQLVHVLQALDNPMTVTYRGK
jgi:hypothetical protein